MAEDLNDVVIAATKFAKSSEAARKHITSRVKADLLFVGNDKFEQIDRQIRGSETERAELVIPILRNYANQIVNRFRSKPLGVDYLGSTPEAAQRAEALNSISKGIMAKGGAHPAIITAVDRQVKGGLGYAMIRTDYANNSSFDQELIYEGLARPDLVIWDAFDTSIDGSKANECIIVEHIPRATAEEEFGKDTDLMQWKTSGFLSDTTWAAPENSVEVATYFKLKRTRSKIYQGPAGVLPEDQVRKNSKMKFRTVMKTTCLVYKIVGNTVVYDTELPLSRLPVVPFLGELIDLPGGRQDYVGIVHFGRSSAKLINYSASLTAERIAVSIKATNFVDFDSIAPYLDTWSKLNKLNLPFVPLQTYDEVNKRERPMPMQTNQQAQIGDVTTAMASYRSLLSTVLGQPEGGTEMDGPSNATATEILTKSRSADLANFQYLDNATQSLKALGRIQLELMPSIYDTPRLLPVQVDGVTTLEETDMPGLAINPDLFNVEVAAGPLYATQMQDEQSKLLALASLLGPEGGWVLAPEIVKVSGVAGAEELSAKLVAVASSKMGIPAAGTPGEDPEAVAALDKAGQAVDQLQAQLDQANLYISQQGVEAQVAQIEAKAMLIKAQMDNENRVLIERLKINASNLELQAKLQAEAEIKSQERFDELARLYASQPDIIMPSSAPKWKRTSIGGQRNDLTGM